MRTTLTFFRPMTHDSGFLESTWPHLSEEDGVRFQFEAEFDTVEQEMQAQYGMDTFMRFISRRRIVTGTFHPGRRVLPAKAVEYELVYEFSGTRVTDLDELLGRLNAVINNLRLSEIIKYERGDVSKRQDEVKEKNQNVA